MADKDIKDLPKLTKDIDKALRKALDNKFFKKLTNNVKETIVKRVQDGYGATPDGKKQSLKRLKDSTIKRRKQLVKKGKLSSNTSPEKSNQTESGEMVEKMKTSSKNLEGTISINNKRKEIYQYQKDGGREWLNLTKEEQEEVDKQAYESIAKELDNILK